jgi:hypothetical protein
MPDYQNSKIYQIICSETGDTYVGSTTQTLAQRKSQHVSKFNQRKKGKGDGTSSYDIIERGNYRIELIELFPCDNKEELHAREGHFIREMLCVNKIVAGRTRSEYRNENREEINEQKARYREQNRDKIKERNVRYREQNRDKINERERLRRSKKRAEQQAK